MSFLVVIWRAWRELNPRPSASEYYQIIEKQQKFVVLAWISLLSLMLQSWWRSQGERIFGCWLCRHDPKVL